uniref:Lipocalin/cytosolic fatty-acid binding domain-containing protein n=1 Tax=Catagonus wagneri TaxID=51154 RepID=A0A8C3VZS5_9CETA
MKIVLLSLVLGLLSAQALQLLQDPLQVSGQWTTLYMASTDPETTRDNSVFKVYLRSISVDSNNIQISFKFFIKVNGKCVYFSTKGRSIAPSIYEVDYAGKNEVQLLPVSSTSLIAYDINVDLTGKKTVMIALLAKGIKTATVQDFKMFKEAVRMKGIPEENIVNITESDDCPQT